MNNDQFTDDALNDHLRRLYQDVYGDVEPIDDLWNTLASQLDLDTKKTLTKGTVSSMQPTPPVTDMSQSSTYLRAGRRWLGSAAAVLLAGIIVIASFALFHTPHPHGSPPASTSSGHPIVGCSPAATQVSLPHNAGISDIALTSPTSGWAVGSINSSQQTYVGQSLILQFKDCHWSPVGPTLPGIGLSSISMTTSDDGWIVGYNGDATSVLLHLIAGQWQTVTIPLAQSLHAYYSSVHMLSATEGWIIAFLHKSDNGQTNEILFHLHAGTWTAVTMPFDGAVDVMPVAPDDAWVAAGTSILGETSPLYHYQQGKWAAAHVPAGMTINHLHLNAPNDAWATGYVLPPKNTAYFESPALLHFDGAAWSPVALDLRNPAQELEMLDAHDGWAIGNTDNPSAHPANMTLTLLQRYVAGTWQTVALPDVHFSSINQIVCATADDCWALGRTQVILSATVEPSGASSYSVGDTITLLHYVAGRWTAYPAA